MYASASHNKKYLNYWACWHAESPLLTNCTTPRINNRSWALLWASSASSASCLTPRHMCSARLCNAFCLEVVANWITAPLCVSCTRICGIVTCSAALRVRLTENTPLCASSRSKLLPICSTWCSLTFPFLMGLVMGILR